MQQAAESRSKGYFRSSPSTAFDQYLQDIQKLPLITDPAEERRLARASRLHVQVQARQQRGRALLLELADVSQRELGVAAQVDARAAVGAPIGDTTVTTATIVGMVGAGSLPLVLAVPMVMGANIGTTVTSTLASLGSIRRPEDFRRAFAAATVIKDCTRMAHSPV